MLGNSAALVAIALAAVLAGGCEKNECETACKRLANCRLAAKQGERMVGERALPADAACMRKCETQPDVFAACEGRMRECEPLLACAGR